MSKFNFVEDPPQEYFCPVNCDLLVSAKQTSCCGKHLSQNVADRLESNMKPCPLCNCANLNTHKDLYFRRIVGQVEVYCNQKNQGCQWKGEVLALDKHLSYGSVDGECSYVAVQCPYLCGKHIARNKLTDHMNDYCLKRSFKCNYCDEAGSYGYIVNLHLSTCNKFPTKCPKSCGELLCRSEIKCHIASQCPLQEVTCEFSYAGCKSNGLCRKHLKGHMEDNSQTHLSLLVNHCKEKEKEMEALKSQVHVLTNTLARLVKAPAGIVAPNARDIGFISPSTLIMTNFSEFRSKREKWKSPEWKSSEWKSPEFYTHIGGYKMCLLVLPYSQADDTGCELMSVFLQILRGDYDSNLKWPFHGSVVVRMLNQLSDDNHIERTLDSATEIEQGCVNFATMKSIESNTDPTVKYL